MAKVTYRRGAGVLNSLVLKLHRMRTRRTLAALIDALH